VTSSPTAATPPASGTTTPPATHTAPAPPKTVAPPRTVSSVGFVYTIVSGDTLSGIAAKFGVTVQAILTANSMVASSIIYAGHKLTIPGVTGPASGTSGSGSTGTGSTGTGSSGSGSSGSGSSGSGPTGGAVVPLSASMEANAKIIISVGHSLNVPSYGLVVALAAAAQESGLENLSYGDQDSVGLFQQRPSAGWGTVAQLENPTYAAELFFGGPSNPNKGRTRGLLDIAGWQSMTVTEAAQAVQHSAYPNAYAKWETSARAWLAELG
jgi:LysM repeat protein